MEEQDMAVSLRRRRVWLGSLSMLLGVGLGLLVAWVQWSASSEPPPPEPSEELLGGGGVYEEGPKNMQESLPTLLSYWLVFASVGFLYGGFRVFRKARRDERIDSDRERARSTGLKP